MIAFRRIAAAVFFSALSSAAVTQDFLKSQPPTWSSRPDAAAFEKIENDRLSAAQRSAPC